jgi:hypothetical protein
MSPLPAKLPRGLGVMLSDQFRRVAVVMIALALAFLPVVEDGCDPGGPTWPDVTGELSK